MEVSFFGFNATTLSIELLVALMSLFFHLLMTDAAGRTQQWLLIESHEFVDVLPPVA